MKRLATALLLLTATSLTAQTAPEVTIDDLKTPASPAFVLMGISPTSVERPTTPRALGLALVNAVEEDDGGALPQNFAMEIAPYWLTPRPRLTFEQYDHPGFWQGLRQTFSVSVATKGGDDDSTETTSDGTLVGAGARASWLIGKRSKLANDVLAAFDQKVIALLAAAGPPQPGQPANAGLPADLQDQLRPFVTSIGESLKQGRWMVEIAAAATRRFPSNETSEGQTEKTAVWITPSYRFLRSTLNAQTGELTQVPTVDFIAVGRYIRDRTVTEDGDPIDVGGRLLWENDMFALSAEFLERLNIEDSTYRLTGMIEYKISENLYLSGTFGKDFDDPVTGEGDLEAILGVNLNLGTQPKLGLPLRRAE